MIAASQNVEDRSRWIAHIDDTVGEVFELMLRQRCKAIDEARAASTGISAKIVFSGSLEGQCRIQVSIATAGRLTGALLGVEGDWDDQMIDDAVGELCNMIAGGWKSRLDAPASACSLSMPAVTRGLKPHDGHTTTRRFYEFDEAVLEVAMTLS